MIIRIWEARVAPKQMSELCAVIQSEMLPELAASTATSAVNCCAPCRTARTASWW